MLREFTDAALALLERHTALRLDPAWVDAAVLASVFVLLLLSVVSVLMRLRALLRRAPTATAAPSPKPDASPAVSALAAAMMAPPPAPAAQPRAAATAPAREPPPRAAAPSAEPKQPAPPPAAREESALARREESPAHTPAAPEKPEAAPLTAQQRKDLALALRDAVLGKVAEGGWFKDGATPLTYRFNRVSLTRMQFEILLELPSPGGSPRAAHALHITVDGRKKLNLEWSADTAARVRFLSPGDWTTAITAWNFADNRPPVMTPLARKRA